MEATAPATTAPAGTQDAPLMTGQAQARPLLASARNLFLAWTGFWWGLTGVMALLFFIGKMSFMDSTRLSLYGISIWLNAWIVAWFFLKNKGLSKMELYHNCLVLWMLSYAITNLLWEIPWVIFSPFVFQDLHTIDDLIAQESYMRSSIFNMYYWILASFGSVDLRTVNHDPTFYVIEIYAFANLATTAWFFYLNNKRSPYRYLVAVLGCGEPVAATFVFSFAEVFADFANMPGDIADTLLALVWTQYQYFVFPLIFGYFGTKLLLEDWRQCRADR